MTPADWDEVKRLFEQALGVPPERRAAWAEQACANREALRRELGSLLSAHARAGAFLDTRATGPRLGDVADEALLGTRLGPYRLEALLGRGGMGVVYRARRSEPELEVAIKVVRVGSDAAQVAARFRAESQILARFEHPHIGRLYDAGSTDDGRPYFVMELVQGPAIDAHCGAARVELRGRLALFLSVCTAVAYAHGRLVVHRDIKPGNILMTASGQPKLLDFGIARLLDEDPAQRAAETGLHLMTPEFASPEQVRGEPATVATDVHALGLLLHVLLTGRSPQRLRSTAPAELVRVVCTLDPTPPSLAALEITPDDARAFAPPESPARLARMLSGDLDSIVARALRKEPAQRYRSADQLAEDVQAYLDGRPVLARGGRWRYTLGKFVRRHRLPVALGAGLLVALLGGLAATVWQTRVARAERSLAERRFADVRQLATRFLFDFHDAVKDLPGSAKAREMVVRTALEHLERLAQEAGGDAQLQLELANAYYRAGRVQGVPGDGNLGDVQGALASLSRAYALLGQPRPEWRHDPEYRSLRLSVAVDLARVQQQLGEYERSFEVLKQAEREARAFLAESGSLNELTAIARVHYELAVELVRRHALAQAGRTARECLRLTLQMRSRWPEDAGLSRRLAPTHRLLAEVAARLGAYAEARENALAAVELRRAVYSRESAASARGLLNALTTLAVIELHGDDARAQSAHAEALELARRVAAEDPQDSQAVEDAASAACAWCRHLNVNGVRQRPRDVCGEALRVLEARADRQLELTQFNLADARHQAGWQRELQGDPAGALRLYERALLATASAPLVGGGVEVAQLKAQIQLAIGRARFALGQPREAHEVLLAAIALLEPVREGEDVGPQETYVAAQALAARVQRQLAGALHTSAACAALERAGASAHKLRVATAGLPRPLRALADYDAQRSACGG